MQSTAANPSSEESQNSFIQRAGKRLNSRGIRRYVISLMVIVLPAIALYWLHIENQKNYHIERNFRSLNEAGGLFENNLRSFVSFLKTSENCSSAPTATGFDLCSTDLARKNPLFQGFSAKRPTDGPCPGPKVGTLTIKGAGRNSIIESSFECKNAGGGSTRSVPLADILQNLDQHSEFSSLFLLGADQRVLYYTDTRQPSEGGLERQDIDLLGPRSSLGSYPAFSITNLEDLINDFNSSAKEAAENSLLGARYTKASLAYSSFFRSEIAGVDHHVFIQPLAIDISQTTQVTPLCKPEESTGDALDLGCAQKFHLVGIIPTTVFRKKTLRLTHSQVALGSAVLLILVTSLPLIYLLLARGSLSVGRFGIVVMTFSTIWMIGALMLFIQQGYEANQRAQDRVATGHKIAQSMASSVEDEIELALSTQREKQDILSLVLGTHDDSKQTSNSVQTVLSIFKPAFWTSTKGLNLDVLGGFDRKGDRCGPLMTARQRRFDKINIAGRQYFKDALSGRLFKHRDIKGQIGGYTIERVANLSDGFHSVIVALPVSEQVEYGGGQSNDAGGGACVPRVQIIGFDSHTLKSPALPRGFLFALVEETTGRVIAHADRSHVLTENLLAETDDNKLLVHHIRSRQPSAKSGIQGFYRGEPALFHSRSLQNAPWSLVVIEKTDIFAEEELSEMLAGGMLLFGLQAITMLFFLIFLAGRPIQILSGLIAMLTLEPTQTAAADQQKRKERRIFDYGILIATLTLLFFADVMIVPSLILGLAVLILGWGENIRPQWRARILLLSLIGVEILLLVFDQKSVIGLAGRLVCYGLLALCLWYYWGKFRKIEDKSGPLAAKDQSLKLKLNRPKTAAQRTVLTARLVLIAAILSMVPGLLAYSTTRTHFDDLRRVADFHHAAQAVDKTLGSFRANAERLAGVWTLGNVAAPSWQVPAPKTWDAAFDRIAGFLLTDPNRQETEKSKPENILNPRNAVYVKEWLMHAPSVQSHPRQKNLWTDHFIWENYRQGGLADFLGQYLIKADWAAKDCAPKQGLCYQDQHGWNYRTLNLDTTLYAPFRSGSQWTLASRPVFWVSVLAGLFFLTLIARLAARKILGWYLTNRPVGSEYPPLSVAFDPTAKGQGLDLLLCPQTALKSVIGQIKAANPTLEIQTAAALSEAVAAGTVVTDTDFLVVTQLEWAFSSPKARLSLLEALEFLIIRQATKSQSNGRIILTADQQILFRLIRPEDYDPDMPAADLPSKGERTRWSALMARFRKIHRNGQNLDIADPLCASEIRMLGAYPDVVETLQELGLDDRSKVENSGGAYYERLEVALGHYAGPAYRKIWEQCTTEEKLALYALARKQLLDTTDSEALRHLLSRRLIVLEPYPKLSSEVFGQFVLNAEHPETIEKWSAALTPDLWSAIRIPIFLLVIVAGLFLYSNAQQEINSVLAILVGAVSAIPVFRNLSSVFGSR